MKFLQNPSIYHPLSTEDIPPSFLESEHQPTEDAPLPDLLFLGHYRRAAETAVSQLLAANQFNAASILRLLYTRLACLVLISRVDIAAQEGGLLTEFLGRNAPGAKDLIPLIPWELRLLLVRLQSLTAADGGRRGIMALYTLAAEVRSHIREARSSGNEAELMTWTERLRDLGLRVADGLVETGELETASRHLDTLTDADNDEVAYRKALLRLRVGHVAGAKAQIERLEDKRRRKDLETLLKLADGEDTVSSWQELIQEGDGSLLHSNNLAVSLLYTGHIADARTTLEAILERKPAFTGALFNLSTIYELCTERSVELKAELVTKLASVEPKMDCGGWEKATFEFKL